MWCTSRDQVLVTEWIDGVPLSEVITDGTQEQRDRAGQLLARFLFSGPARTGLLHADPHPGNFRLLPAETEDGEAGQWRLGVLDFGTVDRLPGGLPQPIGDSLRLTLAGDAEAVYELLREEGFVKESIDLDPNAVLDYLLPIIEPAQVEEFTFTRSWMRNQAARIADLRSPAHQLGKQLNLPPAYLLIHRVTLSTIGVLCQLGATVRLRDELESWVPGSCRSRTCPSRTCRSRTCLSRISGWATRQPRHRPRDRAGAGLSPPGRVEAAFDRPDMAAGAVVTEVLASAVLHGADPGRRRVLAVGGGAAPGAHHDMAARLCGVMSLLVHLVTITPSPPRGTSPHSTTAGPVRSDRPRGRGTDKRY